MCIATTDESGNLISFERMNGGKVTSAIISQDKAYTAAETANDADMAAHLEAKELAARVSGLLFVLPAPEDDELPIDWGHVGNRVVDKKASTLLTCASPLFEIAP
jgi:hypothetical protein